jgi:hypothetical protein
MTRCSVAVAAAILSGSLYAQWAPVPASPGPQNRSAFTLTPWQNDELLLFGGDVATPTATEWSWNGIRWAPVVTPVPRRQAHAMAVDGATGDTLLFGGNDGAAAFTDTWTCAAGVWTLRNPPTIPAVRQALSMAWSPADGAMVLVGRTAAGVPETWRWDGADWSLVNAFAAAGAFTAFTDAQRGEVCLFLSGGPQVEVQRLVGGQWQVVATRIGNAPACQGAFDAARGRFVARGQSGGTRFTYEYDGLSIAQLEGGTVTSVAAPEFALAWHRARSETIFVDAPVPQIERLLRESVPLATAYGTSCVDPSFRFELAAGDVPAPGSPHRLRATGQPTNAIVVAVFGLSHVQNAGLPLPLPIPLGPLGCSLRVEALVLNALAFGLPAQQLVVLPNSPSLLGARYDAQALLFDASGVADASNGLEVQLGRPLPEHRLVETFATAAARDPVASGDRWEAGFVVPAQIGGDGRHGSFDPAIGAAQGNGVFVWNVDAMVIPASRTLSGVAMAVTDGRFYFTDFVLDAGVTVRFEGSVPPQIYVRGRVEIRGTIDASAIDMPHSIPTGGTLAGLRQTTFHARGVPVSVVVPGQPGGAGGPGGGKGGTGGQDCAGTGPTIVNGVVLNDGQPGDDVRVLAGHAYAGLSVGTGGRGSPMIPASGLVGDAGAPFITGTSPALTFRNEFSRGGSGGGFAFAGGLPAVPTIPASALQPTNSAAPAAGAAFPLLPYPASPPPGYSSLLHYLVGGSGGGGGGCHTFGILSLTLTDSFMAGHGGSGGGGAFAVRAGGDLTVFGTGKLLARGGRGVVINGDNPANIIADVDFGVSSPGGGGSGGSVLLQSGAALAMAGLIDTSGGEGSRTFGVSISTAPTQLNVIAQGGAGSHGFYRLEAPGAVAFTGTSVPGFIAAENSGPLADADARTGSRSLWLLPPSGALPSWRRYELVVDVGAQTLLYSDDPQVSPLVANDPLGPVQVRFQGARIQPATGAIVPGSEGPWRDSVAPGPGTLNADRAQAVRFDLVLDQTTGPVRVRELTLVWR